MSRQTRLHEQAVRLCTFVAIGAVAVGCSDAATSPKGPVAERPASRAVVDPLSQRLPFVPGECIVARRAVDGSYLSRPYTVPLPPGLLVTSVSATRFAYRGWAPGVPEPTVIAVCNAPEAPGAFAFLSAAFGARPLGIGELRAFAKGAGVPVDQWGVGFAPMIMQGAAPTYVVDGVLGGSASKSIRATDMAARSLTPLGHASFDCESTPIVTEIIPDPSCDPGTTEAETIPDTPPPPPEEPSQIEMDGGGDTSPWVPGEGAVSIPPLVQNVCTSQVDFPHLSTTAGFTGNINVKAWTQCELPLPMSVQTNLRRESCFLWIFCSWPVISSSLTVSGTTTFVQAPASSTCAWKDGWYEGEGHHVTVGATEVFSLITQSPGVRLKCY